MGEVAVRLAERNDGLLFQDAFRRLLGLFLYRCWRSGHLSFLIVYVAILIVKRKAVVQAVIRDANLFAGLSRTFFSNNCL